MSGDWMDAAACAASDLPASAWTDKPEHGYWGSGHNAAAIAVCRECPVWRDCLRFVLDHEGGSKVEDRDGIYAGTTPYQRKALSQRRRAVAS